MVGLNYFLSGLPKIDLQLHNGEKSGNKALGQKCPPLMFKQRWWFLSFSSFDLSFYSHYFLYGFCFVPSVTSSVLHVQFFFFVHHFISFHIFFFLCSFVFSFVTYLFFHIFSLICFGFLCYLLLFLFFIFLLFFIFIYLCYFLMKCPSIYNF